MLRALVPLVALAACGRIAFDPVADGAVDALPSFGAPSVVDLGITGQDDPTLTGDALEIYVNCNDMICGADRATAGDPWPPVTPLASLAPSIFSPHLSFDGLTLWVVILAPPSQIMVTTRTARTDSWGPLQPIPEITSAADDDGPAVTSDGLTMVFDSTRDGSRALYLTTRTSPTAAWASPVPIAEINAAGFAARPHLSDDRLAIFYEGPGVGGGDIWSAQRTSASDPFDPPQPLVEVNSPIDEQDPWLSPDARLLLWSSSRDGTRKIWQSVR
jgi:hypothetical protein